MFLDEGFSLLQLHQIVSFPASATCERLSMYFLAKCNHLTIGIFEKIFYMQFTLDVYFVLAMLYFVAILHFWQTVWDIWVLCV